MRLAVTAVIVALLAGCDARFIGSIPDLAVAVAAPDGGVPGPIAHGTFAGRGGYFATGLVRLERATSGALSLTLEDDFQVTDAAGAQVILSSRDALGHAIDRERDLVLGELLRTSGTQRYGVPEDRGERGAVFIWSRAFGHEVARAPLKVWP